MKYTKRDREQAILICQACALTPDLHGNKHISALRIGLPHGSAAEALAFAAWSACFDILGVPRTDEDASTLDAEAECLLRDGWSPGDPVVRLSPADKDAERAAYWQGVRENLPPIGGES